MSVPCRVVQTHLLSSQSSVSDGVSVLEHLRTDRITPFQGVYTTLIKTRVTGTSPSQGGDTCSSPVGSNMTNPFSEERISLLPRAGFCVIVKGKRVHAQASECLIRDAWTLELYWVAVWINASSIRQKKCNRSR